MTITPPPATPAVYERLTIICRELLDLVNGELTDLTNEAEALRHQNARFREEIARKDALLLAQAERIAVQSELLSHKAEAGAA